VGVSRRRRFLVLLGSFLIAEEGAALVRPAPCFPILVPVKDGPGGLVPDRVLARVLLLRLLGQGPCILRDGGRGGRSGLEELPFRFLSGQLERTLGGPSALDDLLADGLLIGAPPLLLLAPSQSQAGIVDLPGRGGRWPLPGRGLGL